MVVPDTVRDTKEMLFSYFFLTFLQYVCSPLCILQLFIGLSVVQQGGSGRRAAFVSSYAGDKSWVYQADVLFTKAKKPSSVKLNIEWWEWYLVGFGFFLGGGVSKKSNLFGTWGISTAAFW